MGTGEAIVAAAAEAGLPDGIVQTLRAEPDVIAHVIADVRIQGVSFTGSTRGGRAVAAIAGANGKRTVLELGGSDPFVVLEDADVARAAARASDARVAQLRTELHRREALRRPPQRRRSVHRGDGRRTARGRRRRSARRGGRPSARWRRDDLRVELVGQVARSVSAGAQVVVPGGRRDGGGLLLRADAADGGHASACRRWRGDLRSGRRDPRGGQRGGGAGRRERHGVRTGQLRVER